jgi:NAD(P)-dependent dehydrogenase (short-subunit alcohol dehydrogenase family)
MLIEKIPELKNNLIGKIILLTGAGGGIGLETAKAFAYLGAKIIIAEINNEKGILAEKIINELYDTEQAEFYQIDLAVEKQIFEMADYIIKKYGCPDVIFNNATITKMGAVDEVDIEFWDKSYAVNLKTPLILTQKFLPSMKERNSGAIVFVSSSGASPYMGAYEVFKSAQVELSNTLAMELENTNIHSFTIGPGLVKTETAMNAIQIVASKMNMSIEEFYSMNSQHILDVESAGVGFALSVRNADSYHGQEIGSIQVLMDYNLVESESKQSNNTMRSEDDCKEIQVYMKKIYMTYDEQYNGWKSMNIFQKQWVFRDFKKSMGLSSEQAHNKLKMINSNIQCGDYQDLLSERMFFERLKEYWKHQLKLLQGYEKNKNKLQENTEIIRGWILDIEKVLVP